MTLTQSSAGPASCLVRVLKLWKFPTDQPFCVSQIQSRSPNVLVNIVWTSRGNFADALFNNFSRSRTKVPPAEFSATFSKIPPHTIREKLMARPPAPHFSTNPQRSSQQQASLFIYFLKMPFVLCCGCENYPVQASVALCFLVRLKFLNSTPFPQLIGAACPLYFCKKRVQYASGTSTPENP